VPKKAALQSTFTRPGDPRAFEFTVFCFQTFAVLCFQTFAVLCFQKWALNGRGASCPIKVD
jgi:hypothetical protein